MPEYMGNDSKGLMESGQFRKIAFCPAHPRGAQSALGGAVNGELENTLALFHSCFSEAISIEKRYLTSDFSSRS
jgi:hypothetical protein